MIKIILFDADGVILTGKRFSKHLELNYGIPEESLFPFFNGIFKECIVGNADLKEILPSYLKLWGWEKGIEEFLNCWFKSEHKIDEKLMGYIQNVRKKGIICCIATNQEKHRVTYMLNEMKFDMHFDNLYASSLLGYMKPDLKFYGKIMEDLENVEKEEVLFWDDTKEYIKAAKEFGINAELYTSYNDFIYKMQYYKI